MIQKFKTANQLNVGTKRVKGVEIQTFMALIKTSDDDDDIGRSSFKIYSFLVGATSHLQLI